MEEGKLPVKLKGGKGEKNHRVLIHEDWYDRLKPIYEFLSTGVLEVTSVSVFDRTIELVESLAFEFGAIGWAMSISTMAILREAAEKSITIGKFVYERKSSGFTLGGAHGATLGGQNGGTLGGSSIVVKETTSK